MSDDLPPTGSKRLHAIVTGMVQGVSFRAYTQRQAVRLGLTGWVRNLPDGSVEVLAEGEADRLAELLDWLHDGPPSAEVTGVQASWEAASGEFDQFRIRYFS